MNARALRVLLLVASLVPALAAQADYTPDQIDELGIKYKVFKKLERLPLKLGESHPNLRARYRPAGPGDYINGAQGSFEWSFDVYEFKAPAAVTGDKADAANKETSRERAVNERFLAHSFEEFATQNKDQNTKERQFVKKASPVKTNKAFAGKKLPYEWWEYTDKRPMQSNLTGETFDQLWWQCAAVYDFGDREIALVTDMPSKRDKIDPKHLAWARTMLESLSLLKDNELADADTEGDADLERYADTPERKEAVSKARANIIGLDNWGIFATPNYLVLYSWPKPEKRKDFAKEAKEIADEMDKMRLLYQEYYPPHEKMHLPYSVMRICSSGEEFHKYSENTGPGVIGWFSPATKELVLFVGLREVKTVAFHEGWHQYTDAYFPNVELQRWFDEGTGDFFGSFEWKGGKWHYETSTMRKVPIKVIVNTDSYIPLAEIVTWNKDKFYGEKAPDYYAQGYAMVDFLRNGKKARNRWDPTWDNILDTYRHTMLETKNPKKAVETAFNGVDWDKLNKAWIAWVKDY